VIVIRMPVSSTAVHEDGTVELTMTRDQAVGIFEDLFVILTDKNSEDGEGSK